MCCSCCLKKETTDDNQNIDEVIVANAGNNDKNSLEMKNQSNVTTLPSIKNEASTKKTLPELKRVNSSQNDDDDNGRAKTPTNK